MIKDTYKIYKNAVNMTYSELLEWSKNPCSKKASLSREPIRRNLRLLKKPMSEWTQKDAKDSERTIRFIARHKNQPEGQPVSKDCPYSKRYIALKNWAFDSKK